jgi:hypothetical protein
MVFVESLTPGLKVTLKIDHNVSKLKMSAPHINLLTVVYIKALFLDLSSFLYMLMIYHTLHLSYPSHSLLMIPTMFSTINIELNNVHKWCNANKLTIHPYTYYLQHERPCCIGYTNSSRRQEFVYPIQHGRECCK